MPHTLRTRALGVTLVSAALALLQFVLMQGAAVMDFGSLTGGTQAAGLAILAALGLATLGGTLIYLIKRYGVAYTIAW